MMPRKRQTPKHRAAITSDQMLELVFAGPHFTDVSAFSPSLPAHLRSRFESPFLRRSAWFRFRDELLADVGAGMRPSAFWWYEARERPREGEPEAKCLARLGLLEEWETAQIKAWESIRVEAKGARY
jgi:hypothetical protein